MTDDILVSMTCENCGGLIDPETLTCTSCGTPYIFNINKVYILEIEVGDMPSSNVSLLMVRYKNKLLDLLPKGAEIFLVATRHGVGSITIKTIEKWSGKK